MKYCVIFIFVLSFLGESYAAEVIQLPASKGNVNFPHKAHVYILKDCKKCHENTPGKIKDLGKDWAHKTCKGCHTKMNKGPTYCKGCHIG
jgi:DNA polymerase III alpha subunit (gram-positive type)